MDQFKEPEKLRQSASSHDVTHTRKVIGASDRTNQSAAGYQPGQALGGRYQVISRLGEGGMGVVYRVKQVFLDKEFALKTIDKHCMSDVAIRRFQQEARTAFAIDHPSIIAVHDFGLLDDQTPFLVMEIANGETLGERLKRTGCLTVDQAIPIFVQICFGLAYAHECGVVHRDIKPNNIMLLKGLPLGTEGSVKIVDFGIAKFTEHEGGEIQALTRTGEIFGSPLYMSPEQCAGQRVDHRADIYSLGCVLFEALTGTPPCVSENALTTMMKHQTQPAPTLKEASLGGEFPQAIEEIVATMLAKSPDARYQNLGIAAHDMGALRRGESISQTARSARPVLRADAKTISMRSNEFYALLLGIAVLSAAIAGVSVHLFHNIQRGNSDNSQVQPTKNAIVSGLSAPSANLPDMEQYQDISMEELKKTLAHPTPDKRLVLQYKKLSDEKFQLIAAASWIHDLSLDSSDIDNNSLGRLAKLRLSAIHLYGSSFNDIGAEKLSKCQGLVEIGATLTELSDKGVSKLAKMKGLKTLSISGPGVTDKSLIEVAKDKDLIFLDLKKAYQITNQGLSALERTHLYRLNLESTQIDDAGMVYISKIDTLEQVVLDRTKVTINGIKELCTRSELSKTISVKDCPNLGQKDLQRLQSAFPTFRFSD